MTEETLLRGSIAPDGASIRGPRCPARRALSGWRVVLIFTPIVAISTLGEPPFTATTEQAHAFLVNASVTGRGWRPPHF